MSVILVCPMCGEANTLLRLPVAERCPRCDAPLPAAARELAVQSLLHELTPRPLLITLGAGFAGLWAVVAASIVLFSLISSGSFTANGESVTKAEFLRTLLPWFLPAIAYFGTLAWAVWRERAWVREYMIFAWVVAVGVTAFTPGLEMSSRISNTITNALCLGVAAWYLYGKANVVAYYALLERRSSSN